MDHLLSIHPAFLSSPEELIGFAGKEETLFIICGTRRVFCSLIKQINLKTEFRI